jgi:aryl-alcohol dehydrogenase-like predicted oxidoreductase
MEFRQLGQSGLRVSLSGLGCNNFGQRISLEQSRAVIDKALEVGVTLMDTADSYGGPGGGSEKVLGEVLGARRKDVVIATKFGFSTQDIRIRMGASRRHIMAAAEESLQRLKTDWIDLYQIHSPDPNTPLEETLRAMEDLVRQGKVRYVGCSNFSGWQLVEAQWLAKANGWNRLISCQNEYSLINRAIEKELAPAMTAYGVGLLPYYPLASGMLSGKYKGGAALDKDTRLGGGGYFGGVFMTDRNFDIVEKLEAFAEARGKTILELAFGWMASHPYVSSVIAGATRPEQVEANAAAIAWRLTDAEMTEVSALLDS